MKQEDVHPIAMIRAGNRAERVTGGVPVDHDVLGRQRLAEVQAAGDGLLHLGLVGRNHQDGPPCIRQRRQTGWEYAALPLAGAALHDRHERDHQRVSPSVDERNAGSGIAGQRHVRYAPTHTEERTALSTLQLPAAPTVATSTTHAARITAPRR